MTAEEFEKKRLVKDLLIGGQTELLTRYEFAEAYAKHENEVQVNAARKQGELFNKSNEAYEKQIAKAKAEQWG